MARSANAESATRIRAVEGVEVAAISDGYRTEKVVPRDPLPDVPGYRLIREIGHGGMGKVFEAVHFELEIVLALKMIRQDRVDARFFDRFREEAKTMVDLDHPHIARLYQYGMTEEGPYFTMKYACEGTLENHKQSFRNDARRAAALMIKVADAVHYLHTKGYIHRDLKPHNILIEHNEPLVSDFGLAKAISGFQAEDVLLVAAAVETPEEELAAQETKLHEAKPRTTGRSVEGFVVGTLSYMSPEQVLGLQEQIGPRTDIWALGILLYELICGRRPFDCADKKQLSEQIKKADLDLPPYGTGVIDPRLASIICKCLARNPGDRYETAAQLASDLRNWISPPASPVSRGWFYPLPIALAAMILVAAILPRVDSQTDRPAILSKKDEESRQRQLLSEALRAGKPFTIIGETGLPVTGVVVPFAGRAEDVILGDDGVMRIDSQTRSTVQLIADPGVDEYVYRVLVKQAALANAAISQLGVYVCHQSYSLPTGKLDSFAEFTYTEGIAKKGRYDFSYVFDWTPAGASATSDHYWATDSAFIAGCGKNGESEWREIAIEVRRDKFRVFFDGLEVAVVPRKCQPMWIKEMEKFSKVTGLFSPEFNARGGLGLTVCPGSAYFKNARIEPIKID